MKSGEYGSGFHSQHLSAPFPQKWLTESASHFPGVPKGSSWVYSLAIHLLLGIYIASPQSAVINIVVQTHLQENLQWFSRHAVMVHVCEYIFNFFFFTFAVFSCMLDKCSTIELSPTLFFNVLGQGFAKLPRITLNL